MALTKITGEGVGSLDAITIGDGTAADKKILFDGNAQDFHIGLDDSSDSLTIGLGSTLGTTSHMVIDANGHVTMPSQPAFHAKNNQDVNEFLNASTVHVNIGSHYNNTNGVFTAPTAGNYYFFGGGQSANAGAFYWALYKNGSMYAEFYNAMSGYTYGHASVAAIMTLAENDTVLFKSAGSVNMNTGGQSQFLGYKVS